MTQDTTTSRRIGRRNYLALGALAAMGLAGCSSESGDGTATSTGTSTGTETGAMDASTPKAFTRSFYETLYGGDDIEGANALYHAESQAPELKPADFEPFGGLEAMQAEIETIEIVSQGDGQAFVHADVTYTVPAGSATDTDYLYLRKEGEQWRVNVWLPETPRENAAKATAKKFYQTLYSNNDIEGANAMYHPESSSGTISASDFEQYGGLEAMQASIQSTELVSEGDGTAEVHVDVEYTTPAGSSTATDYVFLKLQGPTWKIDRWLPEAVRNQGESGTQTTSGA